MTIRRLVLITLLALGGFVLAPTASAQQVNLPVPGLVNSPGQQQMRNTPILNRPDRPGHPVGNTLRRINRQGTPLPMPFRPAPRWRRW